MKEVLGREKEAVLLNKLYKLRKEAPKEFEVLKVIAELSGEGLDVFTGLVEVQVRNEGLGISNRSLCYYLNDLEKRGFVRLEKARKGKGWTRQIITCFPAELIGMLNCIVQ